VRWWASVALGALLCGALIHFRPGTFRWVLLGLAVAYGAGSALTPLQLAAGTAIGLIAVGIVGLIVMTIGPDLVTLAIAFFWLSAVGRAIVLIQQPSPWFKWNGVAAIALALLVGCGGILLACKISPINCTGRLRERLGTDHRWPRCWTGVGLHDAAAHPIAGAHSIWELVLHVTAWTRVVACRLAGENADKPEEGDFPEVLEATAEAWDAAKRAWRAPNRNCSHA